MPRKRWLSLLLAVVMAVSMVMVNERPAAADGEAGKVALTEPAPMSIYSHGDGTVTGVGCNPTIYDNYRYGETFGAGLNLAATYTRNGLADWFLGGSSSSCESTVTGKDGTLFMFLLKHSGGGYDTKVVAIKNGVEQWDFEPIICPNGPTGYVDGKDVALQLGKDGNIYSVFYGNSSSQCPGFSPTLFGINSDDGSLRFKVGLDEGGPTSHRVFINEAGLSVIDHSDYRYFDYSGTENASKRTSLAVNSQEQVNTYDSAGNIEGDIFYTFGSSDVPAGLPCITYSWARLLKADGSFVSIGSPECNLGLGQLKVTPDGGFVARAYRQWSNDRLLRFSATGSKLFDIDTGYEGGFNNWRLNNFRVAADGRVIALYRGIEASGDGDGYVGIYSYDQTGNRGLIFSTESFSENTSAADYFQATTFTLATDTIYVALCRVFAAAPTCVDMGGSNWLVKVAATGMTFDYPRSEVFASGLNENIYVGLGDSYSSGHANGPYVAPSGASGCNRSAAAYSYLLDADTSLQWNLSAFVACAGATTDDVINGKGGEPSQLDVLTLHTKVVTISIGGNNALFEPFATACVTSSCAVGSLAYNNSMQVINTTLQDDLEELFDQIALRAPNADVYVVAYPKPFAPVLNPVCYGGLIPPVNQSGARELVENLNNVIFLATQSSGSKFHYVDPDAEFDGHRICEVGGTSYFVGIDFVNTENSFHPDTLGHGGLAAAIKAAA